MTTPTTIGDKVYLGHFRVKGPEAMQVITNIVLGA